MQWYRFVHSPSHCRASCFLKTVSWHTPHLFILDAPAAFQTSTSSGVALATIYIIISLQYFLSEMHYFSFSGCLNYRNPEWLSKIWTTFIRCGSFFWSIPVFHHKNMVYLAQPILRDPGDDVKPVISLIAAFQSRSTWPRDSSAQQSWSLFGLPVGYQAR